MADKVFVVTSPEMGWDCIVGVFKDVSKKDLEKAFPNTEYVVFEKTVETVIEEFD